MPGVWSCLYGAGLPSKDEKHKGGDLEVREQDYEMWSEPKGSWVKPRGTCRGCRNLYPHVPANCEGCDVFESWSKKNE